MHGEIWLLTHASRGLHGEEKKEFGARQFDGIITKM
jgi:hypothetical protein